MMRGSEWWAAAPGDLASEEYARHVLRAVDDGLYWQWRDLQVGPLTVRCMTQPLAVGTAEDHVHLYGMTARLMDQIVEAHNASASQTAWEDIAVGREPAPSEIMPATSLLLDAMAADHRAVLVGPFTQRQPPAKNRKEHAKLHSDKLLYAQLHKPRLGATAADHLWPECKTYILNPRRRPGYACEYGWHVRSGWSPSATELYRGAMRLQPNVIQPEQWAHSYDFQDYSMAALFVGAHGELRGYSCPGCSKWHASDEQGYCVRCGGELDPLDPALRVDLRHLLADPERAHLVTLHGAQNWHTLRGPQ